MNLQEKASELSARIKELSRDEKWRAESALPDGCYFLDKDTVVCFPRGNGDARYPYSADGFNLWAYSSGYITINESTFYAVLPADDGKEPYLNFYAGKPVGGGSFVPVSLLGIARSPSEGEVQRYTVYTPQAVYYLTETPFARFCVRIFTASDKRVCFSVSAENLSEGILDTYLSAYFNCFLMHAPCENPETKWFKQCKTAEGGFVFFSVEDLSRTQHLKNYGILSRSVSGGGVYTLTSTTSRTDYTGGKNNYLAAAVPLFSGAFGQCKQATKFTDTAVAGDMLRLSLQKGEAVRADYVLTVFVDAGEAVPACKETGSEEVDRLLEELIVRDGEKQQSEGMLRIRFSESENTRLKAPVFEKFLGFVMRQVEFAALSKNSGVSLLGVRDVFQQLEAALMWNPKDCRAKIVEALNFIGEDGRPPRQYSMPPAAGALPAMDLRKFIDQGVWIINTIYRYLSYTGDFSILDEVCGYYKLTDRVDFSDRRDTVLDHLTAICRYLIGNIDEETGCLRVLYGDWNDALDGMGVSLDGSQPFGSGVSVMASLQLYANLKEMKEIFAAVGVRDMLGLDEAAERLKKGLQTWAIEEKGGKRRILHGWGDKRSYLVGSSCDSDGKDRVGLTGNAFWVLGGAYEWDKSIGGDILNAYARLDSKYGLKTFEPYFAPDAPGVGRIVNLPKGTAENSATYVHATLFGVWSLFKMGECRKAWERLEKVLPVTHEHISTTQFVMSNSYSYNEEFGMDGESMSDWYTGSANVLVKVIVREVFGMDARLDGLHVHPCAYMPYREASIKMRVRGAVVRLKYRNEGKGKRRISVKAAGRYEMNGEEVFFPAKELRGETEIFVED